ncbi:MAG: teicoplanin resistance protein VanZ [Alphaproteobacteria bacterium]|nr:teicoplanin resistance protein VanZ [Alphaproteobacteria bacterium]
MRSDGNIINTFLLECCQLLTNSIFLFEKGYYDCAYYSLRQSLGVGITMIYLIDIPNEEDKKKKLEAWRKKEKFPSFSTMREFLKNQGIVSSDIHKHLPSFFEKIWKYSQKINKAVHKQGFNFLYISRNHPLNRYKEEDFLSEFESFLSETIGIISILRLAIDPFPILLKDEEIYHRMFDTLTLQYPDNFIEKYTITGLVENYKKTELYQNHYNHFMDKEKQSEAITHIIQNQFVNTKEFDSINQQLHLLKPDDILAVKFLEKSEKITKCYTMGGLLFYFSDRNTNRTSHSYSSEDFKNFSKASQKYNQKYDEAFISVFSCNGEDFYVEHNQKFSKRECDELNNINLNSNSSASE